MFLVYIKCCCGIFMFLMILIDFCIYCEYYVWFLLIYGYGNCCKSGIFVLGGIVLVVCGYVVWCIMMSYLKCLGMVLGDGKCS